MLFERLYAIGNGYHFSGGFAPPSSLVGNLPHTWAGSTSKACAMVLQELGSKLTSALRRLHTDTVVDKETIKAVVGDICRALLESDVNVQMVMKLRKNVEAKAEGLAEEGASAGAAQRRSIQKAVTDELTGMLDPKTAPYKMKKGKSNVVMFVGLQVKYG